MSFLTQAHMISDGDFMGRVNVAAMTAASNITAEDGFDQHHPISARHNLAAMVNLGYQTGLMQFINACALNQSIANAESAEHNSAADDDIQYVVNSNWDRIAEMAAPINS